jgi:hypothetical protein
MFPENDNQFEEAVIEKVDATLDGWAIHRVDGWSYFVPHDSPIIPEKDMVARFYGKGIGSSVRGLFLDGVKVFYRTEEEDKEKWEIDLHGADATDWLKRWDEGGIVWSISMGGFGPGYEQSIQIACVEVLRFLLEKEYNVSTWEDRKVWEHCRCKIEEAGFKNPVIEKLGLSGAQWGAAVNLAVHFYRRGPRAIMTDPEVKHRHIQIQRSFPSV